MQSLEIRWKSSFGNGHEKIPFQYWYQKTRFIHIEVEAALKYLYELYTIETDTLNQIEKSLINDLELSIWNREQQYFNYVWKGGLLWYSKNTLSNELIITANYLYFESGVYKQITSNNNTSYAKTEKDGNFIDMDVSEWEKEVKLAIYF